jgi:hypothetical protein
MPSPYPPLPPECPWAEINRLFPPNVKWCEAPLCGWPRGLVTEPANTWSNLVYLIVGGLLLRAAYRAGRRDLRAFGWATLVMGLLSLIYHASVNFLTQLLDFLGMYLLIALYLSRNLARLGRARERLYGLLLAVLMAVTLLFHALHLPIQAIVGLLILAVLSTEVRLWRQPADRRPFFLSLALLCAASICSVLDVTRTLCDPQDHVLQGHAAWHLLSALSVAAAYRFYAGLPQTPQAALS